MAIVILCPRKRMSFLLFLNYTFNKLGYRIVKNSNTDLIVECYNNFYCRKQLCNNHSLKVIRNLTPKVALTFHAIRLNVKGNFGARFCNLRPSRNASQNHFTFGSFYFFPCKQSFFEITYRISSYNCRGNYSFLES